MVKEDLDGNESEDMVVFASSAMLDIQRDNNDVNLPPKKKKLKSP